MQYAPYGGSYIRVSFQPNQFTATTQHTINLTAFYS